MTSTQDAITFSAEFLPGRGFTTEADKRFDSYDLAVDLYAVKRGRALGFLPYSDHFFMHDFNGYADDLDELQARHESAREYVNDGYSVPKFLRAAVPNIATIAIASGFGDTLKATVSKPLRSFVGGEFHVMFLIDIDERVIYSQGIVLTYVPDEARLQMEKQKGFKRIDPQNRAYYTVQAMAKALFEQMD